MLQNILLSRPRNLLIPYLRTFSRTIKKKDITSLNESLQENQQTEEVFDSNGNKLEKLKKFSGKYFYLPLYDHPLVPGFSRLIQVKSEIAEKLAPVIQNTIVMSVLRNPELTKQLTVGVPPIIPSPDFVHEIKNSSEVYDVGCLCEYKIKETKDLHTSMIIIPLSICKITEFSIIPNSLSEVKAEVYIEEEITEKDVDVDTAVKYQYLRSLFDRLILSAKDEYFKKLMFSLEGNYNKNAINSMIYLAVSSLAIPTFFYKYGVFLKGFGSGQIQEIIECQNISQRLIITTKLLSDLYNKINLWENLEEEYELKKDKDKTTEKLQSIYEALKNYFESEKDETNIQINRFKKNLEGKIVPEHIQKIIDEEIEKFKSMDKHSMESNVIRNYLDILTSLPYGKSTSENLDIRKAREILDQTHYGMDDIKDRILECIAVGNLRGKVQGKILCFVGPPGVGKTSIGESIANALNRKFIRISVGGDKDTSTLKGFRRTYVGAVPGKIVKALKTSQAENPVIMLDEIDKLGERSMVGDPSSVLLEILDPEQNQNFTDDYLDTPIDLSKVFFICTANNTNTITKPLFDRMEMIEVSGYTFNEKKYIFEKYLQPKAIKSAGLNELHSFSMDEKSVEKLIHDYCRESGVRSLQRYTNRIYEKIALKIVQNDPETHLNLSNLKKFIGPAIFSSKKFYEKLPRGVSIGLGFNQYGGSILFIETSKAKFEEKASGLFKITGSIGNVMQESCQIAHTYAKSFLNTYFNDDVKISKFFDNNDIHIHFTEGAVPKDGPSAGVTIVTALISLALNTPILEDLAMTGEVSLGGKVLPIGGVKEKVMAAQREGMKTLCFPIRNKEDIDDLPGYIKNDLSIHFADHYEKIFMICFPKFANKVRVEE